MINRTIGLGVLILGMFALLLLGPVFPHAVAEAAGGKVIYVDDDAAGTEDGTSWANAFSDLQAALAEADEGDQIWIAAGIYYPTSDDSDRDASFVMKHGVAIYGGFAGHEDPDNFNLDNRNYVLNETILSGDIDKDETLAGNVYHVVFNNGNFLDETAVLDGVTIQGGNADEHEDTKESRGGGIYNSDTSPVFRNLIVRDNYAYYGGGIHDESGESQYFHVIVEGNQAVQGGGIFYLSSNPVLRHAIIRNNQASEGAGILSGSMSGVMIDVKIQGNEAEGYGGGIYHSYGEPQLTNVLISGNRARFGGGFFQKEDGHPILTNVTIGGNSVDSDENGGGLELMGGSFTMRNSLVWGNSSNNLNFYPVTVENSLIEGVTDGDFGNPKPGSIFIAPAEAAEAPTTAGDYRLKAGSVAVDAGDNAFFAADAMPDLSHIVTDLDGQPRIFSDRVDLGAYELKWYTIAASPDPVAGGSVAGSGPYGYLEEATVTAIAGSGYTFVNWTEGEEEVSEAAVYSFEVTKDIALVAHFVDETEPELTLDHSPKAWTNDEVTITVGAKDDGSGVALVKWDKGDFNAAHFAGQGTVLTTGSFNVTSNGTYTIYAEDAAGNQVVKTIHIANINTDAPLLTLTPSTEEPTNESVVIGVTAAVYGSDDGNTLFKLNWLAGSRDVVDFAEGEKGEDILGTGQFKVLANGTYTVYAQDAAGNETVKPIAVSNIHHTPPLLTLMNSPAGSTYGEVTISATAGVDGSDNGNKLVKLRWLEGSHDTLDFAGGTKGEDILGTGQFKVSANGTYTVYAQDAAGNEAVQTIDISNIQSTAPVLTLEITPAGPTYGKVTVSVTVAVYEPGSGNTLAKLNWLAGSKDVVDFAEGENGEDILDTGKLSVSKNGTYTVYALDAAGNEAVTEIVISNIRSTDSSGGGQAPVLPDADDSPVTEETEDGQRLQADASVTSLETEEDGTVIEVVRFDEETLDKVVQELEDAGQRVLTVQVEDQEDGVKLTLPAAAVRNMADAVDQAVIDLRLGGSSYSLPIQALNVEQIAEQLDVDVADLNLSLTITKASDEVARDVEQLASAQGAKVVSAVIDFKVIVEADGRSLEISEFGGIYMPRSIVVEEDAEFLTGVRYDPDTQTISFIPSVVVTRPDGTKEVILLAPHNSLYTVIESEGKTFADTEDHWAQADIELLASKFIIYGVSATQFAPDNELTRAEFTALLVRALGLSSSKQVTNSRFADVDANAWYAQVVETAVAAGLAQGQDADHFAPHEQMTREQVAVMVSRALELAGATVADEGDVLANYVDQDRIAEWARQAVARTTAAEIMQGYPDDTFAPQKMVTRAEAAAILKRFLQAVSFI